MSADLAAANWDTMTSDQRHRWITVLAHLAAAVPAGAPRVIVDGNDARAALLAERLATTLRDAGRPCDRLTCAAHADASHGRTAVLIADGPRWRARVPAV